MDTRENANKLDEPLISRDQVIEMFKINPVTMWRYIRDGKLPYYRIGKRLYFKRSEVLESIKINKII